ncbi:MAG TPA: transcription elongation factor GreA [Solirubrobacteraceae bacterium]|nr:transcription elongation factor GreA [Solirubrobacteraceae bacterium]
MSAGPGEAITPEGLEALKEELAQLEGPARQEIARRISAARELGDLKENAEYHIAKEDQAHLETKILRLTERLRNARVVEAAAEGDQVSFGRTVHVVDESAGKEMTFTLVGPTEADVRSGKLSAESPVARALMGHRAGERVEVQTPGGARSYLVKRLE